jgi:hypothetical protein
VRHLLLIALAGCVAEARPPSAATCVGENTQADRWFTAWEVQPDPNEAVARARTRAAEQAKAALCGTGVPALTCEARMQHVRQAGDVTAVRAPRRQWAACAKLVAPQHELGLLEEASARLRADVAEAAAALPDGALFLEPPVWSTGADAGAAGHALREELAQAALRAGRTVLGAADAAASTVGLVLTAVGDDEARLTPRVVTPNGVEERLGFKFPTAFFRLDPASAGRVRGYADFGLQGGNRVGAGGLTVAVELKVDGAVTPRRDFCEGTQVWPTARLVGGSGAELLLFTVDADGNGLLLDRSPGALANTNYALDLLDTSDGRQDAFVAVAVPAGATGAWSSWGADAGPCRLAAPLRADLFPPDAAFTLASFTVHREGTGLCTQVVAGREAEREAARTAPLDAFPLCGAAR